MSKVVAREGESKPLRSASRIMAFRTSMTNMNNNGDNGLPWRKPLA